MEKVWIDFLDAMRYMLGGQRSEVKGIESPDEEVGKGTEVCHRRLD